MIFTVTLSGSNMECSMKNSGVLRVSLWHPCKLMINHTIVIEVEH